MTEVPLPHCSAPHPRPLNEGYVRLKWYSYSPTARTIRVLAWTCHEHRMTSYEMCSAGGLAYFRRTVADDEGALSVKYSDSWLIRVAHALWDDLLLGNLR